MTGASSSIRRCLSRDAIRRMAGVVVLVLFAHQSIAPVLFACDGAGVGHPRMDAGSMGQEHHRPADNPTPNRPAPRHDSNCDHSVPASGCCMAAGCATAIAGTSLVAVAPRQVRLREVPVSIEGPRSPEYSPDVPPPRT
jgi:hypothetical protein